MRAYLDTNALEIATRLFPSAPALEEALGAAGFELSLGTHVMYELARAFTSPASSDTTLACLAVLAGMERIHYVPQTPMLIEGEVVQARFGGQILHKMPEDYAAAMKSELYLLSRGHADDAKRFIAHRDQEVRTGHARIAAANRAMVDRFLRERPNLRVRMRTFEGFKETARPMWPTIITKVTGPLPDWVLDRILARSNEFPVLNTWLNVQLHLAFLSAFSGETPSVGRIDDYRNIMESNAADLFITRDAKLLKVYPMLNPFRSLAWWDDFASTLNRAAAGERR